MKLLDKIRRNGQLAMPRWIEPSKMAAWREHGKQLAETLNDSQLPAVLVDNVADYYYTGTDQEQWNLRRDFPNVAPPFPAFWMEHRIPKMIHSEIGDSHWPIEINGRVGWLIFGVPREHVTGYDVPECKWVLIGEFFIDYGVQHNSSVEGPHGTCVLAVDEHGAVVDRPGMQSFAPDELADMMRCYLGWWNPVLLAMCFMHCKNVLIEDEPVHAKHAKAVARKNNGVQPVKFKRLIIEPLKQILRREGSADSKGVPHAMHICRGHFKDYREGKGLFGKYHQVVWTPMTVRGSKGTKPAPREMEIRV